MARTPRGLTPRRHLNLRVPLGPSSCDDWNFETRLPSSGVPLIITWVHSLLRRIAGLNVARIGGATHAANQQVRPSGDRFLSDDGPFIERITSIRSWERYRQLYAARDDVRVTEWMLGRDRVVEWLNSVAVCQDPLLASLVPPLPPFELRELTASPSPAEYLWTGLVDAHAMISAFERHCSLPSGCVPSVLDFGCGNGRLLRYLSRRPDLWHSFGCDVNPDNVAWCVEHLDGAHTSQSLPLPPLPFESNKFDLVICLSVFSHLSEARAQTWWRELARVLTPDGLIIITTHGISALESIRDSIAHQTMFRVSMARAKEMLHVFASRKFLFLPYEGEDLHRARAGDSYGNAFIHPLYFRDNPEIESLQVVEHLQGGMRGWQDIVLLRKGAPASLPTQDTEPCATS